MQVRTEAGRETWPVLCADPSALLVGLDFDGTLAPIVARPDDARALPGTAELLGRLGARVRCVAVVTGRPAAQAVQLGGLSAVEGLVVLGHYGLERWEGGRVTAPGVPPGIEEVRRILPAALAAAGAPQGSAIEDKQHSLAVHVRGAADPEAAMAMLAGPLAQLAAEHGLVVEPGRRVLELRPPGVDKGAALLDLADQVEAGAVLFVGDDLGDLAAFAAVERWRSGGRPGLTVASASAEESALAERADLVVDGPAGVQELLRTLAG